MHRSDKLAKIHGELQHNGYEQDAQERRQAELARQESIKDQIK